MAIRELCCVSYAYMVPPFPVQLFISTVSNLGTKRHQTIVEDAKQMKASPFVCMNDYVCAHIRRVREGRNTLGSQTWSVD